MRRGRAIIGLLVALFLVEAASVLLAWLRVAVDDNAPSQSLGMLSRGSLVHGHTMPPWSKGFRSCSYVDSALGHQYSNGRVRDTLLAAFASRADQDPARVHILGETARRKGGPFHGHRTHQNGLSADIFMPVRDEGGSVTTLPTWPWNGLGYWWEFDAEGRSGNYRIDFEELAALITAVDKQARGHGLKIVRVIIAPEFVPLLLKTPSGKRLGELGDRLTRQPVWVRHDEHVHFDFAVVTEDGK